MSEPKRRKQTGRPIAQPPPEVPPPPPAADEDKPTGAARQGAPTDGPAAAGFPIVGIGASAGGLAAFEAFFSGMPADSEPNLAVVLVQHLAPDHKSILTDLVRRYTRMQVSEVEDGMEVRPNCAYIIPPNRDLALMNGTLHLLEPGAPRGMRLPIDFFFRSLAQDQRERAICIVLAGTGSDGTLGLRAVKAAGGMAMAQDPGSTEYDGMPRSAIATGLVDFVLPPAAMPAQLIAYVDHAFGLGLRSQSAPAPSVQDTLSKICVVLRAQTGRDFSQYKANTLIRRVERRMALHQIERADDYLQYLQRQPNEVEGLFRDLLIGVTHFFRDPDAFAVLNTEVIPRLLARRRGDTPVRMWVCGCSTGEEAYSLAILFHEQLETLSHPVKVQIFATDLDRKAIEQARSGVFPASIAADLTPERLARCFVQEAEGGHYRVRKAIRDLLIFSVQDVISDPPFSRLDLISCRNLLIYLNVELQKKLITLFHYSLNPGGVLFLGTSETVGELVTLFTPLDRNWKLYQRQEDLPGAAHPTLGTLTPRPAQGAPRQQRTGEPPRDGEQRNLRGLTEQALLAHIALVGVLVTARGEILHIFGRTGMYLEPAQGDAGLNILAMAREGLQRELTIALHKAVAQREVVSYHGLQVRTNGAFANVNLTVRPVAADSDGLANGDVYLVVMEEASPDALALPAPAAVEGGGAPASGVDQRIATLEQELRANEEYLQTALEEMETANEELQSTNEELQSVNEELQSTNEELETSKEELQSVNEELATVNAELQQKLADLQQANNDMNNLLAGTGVGTLFVDFQLRIARFTPAITQVIKLIQSDVGRSVGDIVSNLVGYDRLVADVKAVLDTLVPQEFEVQTRSGGWYLMRIRPYRTLDNVIEGAVITFVEVTQRKQIEMALRSSEARFAKAFHASPDGLVIARRADAVIIDVNPSWETLVGYSRQEVVGRGVPALELFAAPGDWDRITVELAADGSGQGEALELRHRSGDRRWALVSLELLDSEPEPGLLIIFHDVTEHRRVEQLLQRLRHAEERFTVAFQASPTALSLARAVDGRITEVNEAFLTLFGYQRDEVLDRTAAELGIDGDGAPPAEVLRQVRERGVFRELTRTARSRSGRAFSAERTTTELELEGVPHLLTFTLVAGPPPEEAVQSPVEPLSP